MELYFIRHAQSQNNALAARGATDEVRTHDPELTDLGKQQAARLADFLAEQHPDAHTALYDPQNRRGITLTHLYASLMVRAVNTGTIIAERLGLPLTAWSDWHEEGGLFLEEQPGQFVGRPGNGRSYFTQTYPKFALPDTLTDAGWWTGTLEPAEDRPRRARRVLAELLERHGGTEDHVGVVSHGGFYSHIINALMDVSPPYKLSFLLNNVSVSRIVLLPTGSYVVYQNRCEFLPTELVTASAALAAMRLRPAAVVEGLALGLLLALAAYVRTRSAGQGWYPDEGAHLSIALHLLRGQTQFLAVQQSVLLFSRLPAFEWLLAGALALAGAGPGGDPTRGLAVLRALTGGLGVLNTLGVYLVARPLAEGDGPRRWLPLLAAGLFIAYPAALTAGRFGFSYHLLAALLLGAVWAAQRYLATDRRAATAYLALAAALIGLGTLADVWGWVLPPLLLVLLAVCCAARYRWGKGWRAAGPHLALAVGLAGLPLALYAAQQLLTVPAAFLFDLHFVFGRVGGGWLGHLMQLGDNAVTLFAQDGWWALGAVGLLALRPAGQRAAVLIFWGGALALIGSTTPLYSLSFYYLIPLLPFVPVGMAGLVSLARGRIGAWLAFGLAAALGLGTLGLQVVALDQAGLPTPVDQVLIAADDAQAAAAYLAGARPPGALVLASPALAWLLPGDVADVQMALAYAGQSTPHVPADLPRDRYAYRPAFERAQFVVVDNLWRNWAVFDVAGAAALRAEVEQWPVVFQAGEVTVYQRPP